MNEEMQQQIVALVKAAMSGDQKATQQVQQIMDAAKKGDQQATQIAQMIQQVAQQMQGRTMAQRLGGKLAYYNYLKCGGKVKKGQRGLKDGIQESDTVHVNGKAKTLTDYKGRKRVQNLEKYTDKDYQNDVKSGTKDAWNRVVKSDISSQGSIDKKKKK